MVGEDEEKRKTTHVYSQNRQENLGRAAAPHQSLSRTNSRSSNNLCVGVLA